MPKLPWILVGTLLVACAPAPVETGKGSADTADSADSAGEDSEPTPTADTDDPPADVDGDGFDTTTDCDDGNAAVHPGAVERCDDVDEDCDGVVDGGLRVPADQPTLDAALEAAIDGATICVAAGTYAARVETEGRTVTVEGVGSGLTVLAGDGLGSAMRVEGGAVTLRGLTLTGGVAAQGAGLAIFDAEVTLEDVEVRDNTCDTLECEGTGIYGARAQLTATNLRVTGNTQSAPHCTGAGLLWTESGGAVLTDVDVSGNHQTGSVLMGAGAAFLQDTDTTLTRASFDENDQYAEGDGSEYGVAAGAGVFILGGTFTGESVSASRNHTTLGPSASSATGIGLSLSDGELTVVGLAADDNVLDSGEVISVRGVGSLVYQATLRAQDASFSRNEVVTDRYANVSGTGLSGLYSVLELEQVVIDENNVSTEVYTPEYPLYGAGLDTIDVQLTATHLAVRGNSGDLDQPIVGGGISLNQGTYTFTNLIVAGNGVDEADTEDGVAMCLTEAVVTVTNADIVGNGRDSWCCTAPVRVSRNADVHFVNVAVVGNIGSDSGGFYVEESTLSLAYGDVYGNTEPVFQGMDDPTGTGGNVAVDPMYTDVTGSAVDWDLHLASGSPLIDAGDPAVLDADGTRSDVGAFGGPGGSW